MNPRDFSRALADSMRDRVIASQRYLDEHQALEQLGMPIEIARHALDRHALDTAPGRTIRGWDGKALLALHHARDNGKTHGAALWVLARLRAGKRTVWISCPGILSFEDWDRVLKRAQHAHAVVVDDVGPGLGGTDGFKTKLAAWIQERGHLPTILTSNANTGQLEHYLGGRVVSRLKQAGKLVSFEREANLRKPDREELDDEGRGKRWAASRWMVWRFGCEPDDRMDGGRVVHGYRVGDDLEQARLGIDQLHALAMRFGLSIFDVEARAREMDAEAERVRGLLAGWTPPEMATTSTMAEIVDLADGDVRREKRAAKVRDAAAGLAQLELAAEPPRWTMVFVEDRARPDRDSLTAVGFCVEPLGDGFVVKRKPPKGERGRVPLTMSPKLKTQPMAWDFAARLCGL